MKLTTGTLLSKKPRHLYRSPGEMKLRWAGHVDLCRLRGKRNGTGWGSCQMEGFFVSGTESSCHENEN